MITMLISTRTTNRHNPLLHDKLTQECFHTYDSLKR